MSAWIFSSTFKSWKINIEYQYFMSCTGVLLMVCKLEFINCDNKCHKRDITVTICYRLICFWCHPHFLSCCFCDNSASLFCPLLFLCLIMMKTFQIFKYPCTRSKFHFLFHSLWKVMLFDNLSQFLDHFDTCDVTKENAAVQSKNAVCSSVKHNRYFH